MSLQRGVWPNGVQMFQVSTFLCPLIWVKGFIPFKNFVYINKSFQIAVQHKKMAFQNIVLDKGINVTRT